MGDALQSFREIVRWETSTWNALDELTRRLHNVPLGRYEVLHFAAAHVVVSVDQIARHFRISPVKAGALVHRLEAAGYCVNRAPTARPDELSVSVTASGKELVSGVEATLADYLTAEFARAGLAATASSLAQRVRGAATDSEQPR